MRTALLRCRFKGAGDKLDHPEDGLVSIREEGAELSVMIVDGDLVHGVGCKLHRPLGRLLVGNPHLNSTTFTDELGGKRPIAKRRVFMLALPGRAGLHGFSNAAATSAMASRRLGLEIASLVIGIVTVGGVTVSSIMTVCHGHGSG